MGENGEEEEAHVLHSFIFLFYKYTRGIYV